MDSFRCLGTTAVALSALRDDLVAMSTSSRRALLALRIRASHHTSILDPYDRLAQL
jgi:hypothetical protein